MIPLTVFMLVIAIVLAIKTFFIVEQQTNAIIERFGKFNSVRKPGLQMKIPFVDRVVERVSLRIRQLDVMVETKTEDNVFLGIKVSVQFQVLQASVYDAYYKLDDPENQITAYIFDVVRAEVPRLKLDDVFAKKDDVAVAIRNELQEAMNAYGYNIVKALVTDIDPDEDVKHAMNRINAAEREKKAAEFEAEADRIKIVAKAKAEAESKQLQGKGIADQRREIAKGLEESVKLLNTVNIPPTEASALIIVTQHYDTLQSIGAKNNSSLILLPNSPDAAGRMLTDTLAAFAASAKVVGPQNNAEAPSHAGKSTWPQV
ncbi:SPFH domain-containing protein [Desulfosarcina sp. OttesenSCG-928-G10]|nr:SPFH domain-containing protein [Desulfosarcina sp. OttesenSCG-928-G10]